MSPHGSLGRYAAPQVVDYGTLVEITAFPHLLLGTAGVSDLTFSSPNTPGGPGELPGATSGSISDGVDPGTAGTLATTGTAGGGTQSAGGGAPGGGPSGGGGHGQLPFTGVAVGAIAAVGSGLAAAGGALRRRLRRQP
jgi:hypothetical protein